MPIDILMPALSPTMEKGNLIHWAKAVGDRVRPGDLIAEVETDKATMDVEASVEGVLARIVVPAGTADVPVNDIIGLIAMDGEPIDVVAPAAAEGPPAEERPESGDATHISASGSPAHHTNGNGRIFASPIARRLMAEAGLDAAALTGSGPRGRILERDVKAAIAAREARQVAAPAPAAAPDPVPLPPSPAPSVSTPPVPVAPSDHDRVRSLFEPGSFEDVPHDAMRLTIARRLSESKRTVPHFYLSADCAIDALLGLRAQLNQAAPADRGGQPAYRLTVNDFVVKAMALALKQVPDANVSFTEESLLRHRHADIGVAVAIPGGLITPIVRRAEARSISTISAEIKDFADRARERRLKPQEYQGGTASISNLGMHGVREFAAIINPPQASILAVGAGEQRVVVRDGAPAVATMMTATLSVDHRAVDGATAAELLAAFKARIEQPLSMLA